MYTFTIGSGIFLVENPLEYLLVTMRITAAAKAWRKVEGVVGDRRISCKRKGYVLSSCVTPACMNSRDDDGTYTETTEGPGLRITTW